MAGTALRGALSNYLLRRRNGTDVTCRVTLTPLGAGWNRLALRRMVAAEIIWPLHRPPLRYPHGSYPALLAATVARHPERTAIVFRHQQITYRELDALSNALTHALGALGVTRGERVALFMTNRPEYVIAFLAIAKLGAVATP